MSLAIIGVAACSTNRGCDGSLVEVEGPTPPESFWREPFEGRVIADAGEAKLPFEPVSPRLEQKPVQITWTDSGTNKSSGRISRLAAAPGATVGPRISWSYETPDGPFFVQQALVSYDQSKLEHEANECDTGGSQTNPGFSMTELRDGKEALLIAQSLVLTVTWIDEPTITDQAAVSGYENVALETQLRAPGDALTVDQFLDIANDLGD